MVRDSCGSTEHEAPNMSYTSCHEECLFDMIKLRRLNCGAMRLIKCCSECVKIGRLPRRATAAASSRRTKGRQKSHQMLLQHNLMFHQAAIKVCRTPDLSEPIQVHSRWGWMHAFVILEQMQTEGLPAVSPPWTMLGYPHMSLPNVSTEKNCWDSESYNMDKLRR